MLVIVDQINKNIYKGKVKINPKSHANAKGKSLKACDLLKQHSTGVYPKKYDDKRYKRVISNR